MSPTIRRGIINPVELLAPKARAINVTLKIDNPFNPDLESPIKKAAEPARIHEDKGKDDSINAYPFKSSKILSLVATKPTKWI